MASGDGRRVSARSPATRRQLVEEIVGAMTVAEKVGQLTGLALGRSAMGVSAIGPVAPGLVTIAPRPAGDMARQAAEVQARIAATARRPIPALVLATHDPTDLPPFPVPLARAATWDPDLVGRLAAASAAGLAAAGVHATLTPSVVPALLPSAAPDVASCLGDDPVLIAALLRAHVVGLQGLPAARFGRGRVAAVLPDLGGIVGSPGDTTDPAWSSRFLRTTVWAPAEAAVRAGAVMAQPSGGVNDGVPVHTDSHLLRDVLRGEWGFEGIVAAGLPDIVSLARRDGLTDSPDAALALAVEAGIQAVVASAETESGDRGVHRSLTRLLAEGRLAPWLVDAAVTRILLVKAAIGLFDGSPPRDQQAAAGGAARHALATETAAGSLVLLSDPLGVLPLADGGAVAVTTAGPVADSAGVRALVAALSAQHPGGGRAIADPSAVEAEDAAVLVVVDDPVAAAPLLGRLVATGTPCVALVCGGDPRAVGPLVATTSSILLGWQPATAIAATLVAVLRGDEEPGGRLPLTIGGNGRALFPLGHGSGYTEFEYSHLRIGPDRTQQGAQVVVQCRVTNVGARAGKEVVQVHVQDDVASVVRPGPTLAAFAPVTVPAGGSVTVTLRVGAERVALWDRAMRRVVEPGRFTVLVGRSATDIRLRGTFTVDATRDLTSGQAASDTSG